MSDILDIKLNSAPNEDLVYGFPGISASWPRIEGVVEVRPKDISVPSLLISSVKITLFRTDSIHPPSTKTGINAPRKEQNYIVGKEQVLFTVTAGRSYEEVLGLDLPFILSLPTDKATPASISLSKGLSNSIVETTYKFYVTISYGKQAIHEHHQSFPIRIKPYNTLTFFGLFRIPVSNSIRSPDHLVTLDYSLTQTAFGPGDIITAIIKVTPNPDWSKSKRVRLNRLTMQVQEVITFSHEGDEPVERKSKIAKTFTQLDMKIPEMGHLENLSLQYPILEHTDRNGFVSKERQDIPNVCRNGFTTTSALYKIDYFLIIKARFTHAKDIEAEIPIVICPFDNSTCMSLTTAISEAVEYANRANRKSIASSRIYRANDVQALETFGRKLNPHGGKSTLCIKVR